MPGGLHRVLRLLDLAILVNHESRPDNADGLLAIEHFLAVGAIGVQHFMIRVAESGNVRPSRSANFASFAGLSGEIPITANPAAARLDRLSRKSHASFVQPGVIAAG